MRRSILNYYTKGVYPIQDWVQLPTREERKQWEKRNTKPEWVVKTKMIVTPTEEQIYEYERLDD